MHAGIDRDARADASERSPMRRLALGPSAFQNRFTHLGSILNRQSLQERRTFEHLRLRQRTERGLLLTPTNRGRKMNEQMLEQSMLLVLIQPRCDPAPGDEKLLPA